MRCSTAYLDLACPTTLTAFATTFTSHPYHFLVVFKAIASSFKLCEALRVDKCS
jgi:hypothetical protein